MRELHEHDALVTLDPRTERRVPHAPADDPAILRAEHIAHDAYRGGGCESAFWGRRRENPRRTGGFSGGRYWDRTSDLFRVREARYRCANRPCPGDSIVSLPDAVREVATGFEPVWTALQAAASPLGHATMCVGHLTPPWPTRVDRETSPSSG